MSNIKEKYSSEQIHFHSMGFGIRQYITYELGNGIVPMPADASVYAIMIMKGQGEYRGISVSEGDAVVVGVNKEPVIGISQNMTLYILEIDFLLFYHFTGILPMYCSQVIKLKQSSPFVELCRLLKEFPQGMWRRLTDNYLGANYSKRICSISLQMERIHYISGRIQKDHRLSIRELSDELGLSYRQLERDFKCIFGMSPLDYQRIVRFQASMRYLQNYSPVQAAALAGYCDQSHMTKDFRQMSPWTPAKSISFLSDLLPMQGST